MTDQDLLHLDKMGFIPGPDEGEEAFLERVKRTKEQYEKGGWIPEAHWDWVREFLYELFNVKPLYICAFYSNRNLAPWQGAASWIEGKKLSSVQLREGLRKGKIFGYRREEILAHEAVHGVRSGFDDDESEEFFAYMTSGKKWRRVLGPILRRPWEAWPLLLWMIGGVFWAPFYLFASFWVGVGFFRLIRQHICLKKAADHIDQMTQDNRRTRAILFRLTDEEIQLFSKKRTAIDLFAANKHCLRWRVIKAYLQGDVWPKKSS